jgi:phosphopantothenoylcysteine decarboxylase/phosphopantothenate--cysteine ligase
MRLEGKNILLGITGSVAAYKAAILLRCLVKEGANVQVVTTPAGKEFITPVTLSALSGKPVISEFFGANDGAWNSHVDLGIWADALVIAPATASTIGKMAHGIADNMLVTTYLSARCTVFVAPAMDLDMFSHPSTQNNLKILRSYGNIIIEPATGPLASGLDGKGRMEEPEQIVNILAEYFDSKKKLQGKTFLVTAGPTYEKIDPVRFIGNYSSGKMGYAIAEEFAEFGAVVLLISGPTHLAVSNPLIKLFKVESAEEMFQQTISLFPGSDGGVLTAAVADFTPVQKEPEKIKRDKNPWQLYLQPTRDIAAHLGTIKSPKQILVGFALETSNELENARKKLMEKNLDFIVLNSLKDPGSGFNTDTNKITIVDKGNNIKEYELKSKKEVAHDIVENIVGMIQQ